MLRRLDPNAEVAPAGGQAPSGSGRHGRIPAVRQEPHRLLLQQVLELEAQVGGRPGDDFADHAQILEVGVD